MAATTAREYRVSTAEVPKYEYDEDNETWLSSLFLRQFSTAA
jgi:hypothetical protein